MTDSKYEILIYWDPQDSIFVAEIPELPGCLAHGSSRTEAISAAEDAIALWIKTALEDGVTIPAPLQKEREIIL